MIATFQSQLCMMLLQQESNLPLLNAILWAHGANWGFPVKFSWSNSDCRSSAFWCNAHFEVARLCGGLEKHNKGDWRNKRWWVLVDVELHQLWFTLPRLPLGWNNKILYHSAPSTNNNCKVKSRYTGDGLSWGEGQRQFTERTCSLWLASRLGRMSGRGVRCRRRLQGVRK